MIEWIVTNEVPFSAVLLAIVGCGIAALLALAALADFAVFMWHKIRRQ